MKVSVYSIYIIHQSQVERLDTSHACSRLWKTCPVWDFFWEFFWTSFWELCTTSHFRAPCKMGRNSACSLLLSSWYELPIFSGCFTPTSALFKSTIPLRFSCPFNQWYDMAVVPWVSFAHTNPNGLILYVLVFYFNKQGQPLDIRNLLAPLLI